MPKQVGLIIPRGPFLNLEWFVGLLEGDNWIHIGLATGMHTQSTVECKCTFAHTQASTHKSVYKCTHAQKGLFPTLRLARTHAYARTHTNGWQWKKDRDWVGTGSWVTLPSVPTRLCPSFHWDSLWNVCVHVCTWERQHVWVGNGERQRNGVCA